MDDNNHEITWSTGAIFDPVNDIGESNQFLNGKNNKIFFTSDTHFCHKNILVYEAENRPFKGRDEMNEELIKRWNSVVGSDDIVFHLGDFSFGGFSRIKEIVSRLNGKIHILLGNHDRYKHFDWENLGFAKVYDNPFMIDGKYILSHEPLNVIPDGKVNVYGHVHGSKYFNTVDSNRICVCVERWNCTPIEYDKIKELVGLEKNA